MPLKKFVVVYSGGCVGTAIADGTQDQKMPFFVTVSNTKLSDKRINDCWYKVYEFTVETLCFSS